MAQILSGLDISAEMRAEMKEEVARLKMSYSLTPGLAVVLVGDDPASTSYIKGKRKACESIGLHSVEHNLDTTQPESDLLTLIQNLNEDPALHGILVQLPLPDGFNEQRALNLISPDKDVDGLHPINLGKLVRLFVEGLGYGKSLTSFDYFDFVSGLTAWAFQLRMDGLVLVFLLPLYVGLLIKSLKGKQEADSIMVIISGILLSVPILSGFTEFNIQPYRWIPLIAFFAIGVGILFSKSSSGSEN